MRRGGRGLGGTVQQVCQHSELAQPRGAVQVVIHARCGQQRRHLRVRAPRRRVHQRPVLDGDAPRLATVRHARVRPGGEQHAHGLAMAGVHRHPEHRAVGHVLVVDVGAGLEEELHDLGAVLARGVLDRRLAVLVGRVHRGGAARAQRLLDGLRVAGLDGREEVVFLGGGRPLRLLVGGHLGANTLHSLAHRLGRGERRRRQQQQQRQRQLRMQHAAPHSQQEQGGMVVGVSLAPH